MAEQLHSLYVAFLVLALIGVIVLGSMLLSHGLRWIGRRVSLLWRNVGRDDAGAGRWPRDGGSASSGFSRPPNRTDRSGGERSGRGIAVR